MKKKIELIKKITGFHPTYGTDLGWSTYTGGMTDTGRWFWEVLVDIDYKVLEEQYLSWIKEDEIELAKEVVNTPRSEKDEVIIDKEAGWWYIKNVLDKEMERAHVEMWMEISEGGIDKEDLDKGINILRDKFNKQQ